MFGGVAAHTVSTFRDPAIYDARHLDSAPLPSTGAAVTSPQRTRRHGWGQPRQFPLVRQLHLDPTTGGLR